MGRENEEMKKWVRRILLAAAALWLVMGIIDFSLVCRFERPLFCILDSETAADDGGSGTYRGLGYAFAITGRFLPEEQDPGVTAYEAWIFHIPVLPGART